MCAVVLVSSLHEVAHKSYYEIGHIFLAEDLLEGESEPEHTEDLTIKVVPFIEAYKMVLEFDIKDSLAIIGINRVYDYLRKEGRLDKGV